MKASKWIVMAVVGLLSVACSHGSKIEAGPATVATKPGVISAWADWVKSKDKKYDLDFHLRNESDKYIIVMLYDMSCKRGGDVGRMKYTFFNTGERTIDMGPHQEKSAHMVCSFGTTVTGPYEIDIQSVYANPAQDRRTPGPVIASNIVWKISDKEKK